MNREKFIEDVDMVSAHCDTPIDRANQENAMNRVVKEYDRLNAEVAELRKRNHHLQQVARQLVGEETMFQEEGPYQTEMQRLRKERDAYFDRLKQKRTEVEKLKGIISSLKAEQVCHDCPIETLKAQQ